MNLTDASVTPAARVSTVRVIFKCRCGRKAYDYTRTRTSRGVDKFGTVRWGEPTFTRITDDGKVTNISWDAFCDKCKTYKKSTHVHGTKSDHKCDARCTNATGASCDCQCGGKNHGAGWL